MVLPHVSIKCHVQYVPGQVRCHAAICVPVKSSMGWSPDMEQKCNDVEHVKINQLNQTEHWTDSVTLTFSLTCSILFGKFRKFLRPSRDT